MKFLHVSDLHLGKKVNGYSMLDEQSFMLKEIIKLAINKQVEGILVAGDVYDKTVPPTEAVALLDDFLNSAEANKIKVFIIYGNHDSGERVAFASSLLSSKGVFISKVYNGKVDCVTLEDQFGKLNVYLMPFLKPSHVRQFYPEIKIESYNDAIKTVISNIPLNKNERNILMAHQFVTGAETSESEELAIGGVENVDGSLFDDFDYVALGHLHRSQSVYNDKINYSGSLIKYSFSEIDNRKSYMLLDFMEKNNLVKEKIAYKPINDLAEIKGTLKQLTDINFISSKNKNDYYRIILTDDIIEPDTLNILRNIYPNIMKLEYEILLSGENKELINLEQNQEQSPMEIFNNFFMQRNERELSNCEQKELNQLINEIWGVDK